MWKGEKEWKFPLLQELQSLALSGQHSDVVFISKENLRISAHKAILSRDKFWKRLFLAGECCNSLETTVLLPDYSYREVWTILEGYYKERLVFDSLEGKDNFEALQRSYNRKAGVKVECRICKTELDNIRELSDHVEKHVRDKSTRDILKYRTTQCKDNVKCSFTHPNLCTIEKDRKTLTNGIFNDVDIENEAEMIEQIKAHYRRHLRDEMKHITDKYGDCDNSLPIDAQEDTHLHQSNGTKRSRDMSSDDDDYDGRATKKTMTGLENEEESDYSGGFSSPDMSDDEDVSLGLGVEAVSERPSSPKTTTSGNESDQEGKKEEVKRCRECDKAFKTPHGFKKHIVTHLYNEEAWQIGEKPYRCPEADCKLQAQEKAKGKEKVWTTRAQFISHRAIAHKKLEDVLAQRNEVLSDWEQGETPTPRETIRNDVMNSNPSVTLQTHGIRPEDRDELFLNHPAGSKSPRDGNISPPGPNGYRSPSSKSQRSRRKSGGSHSSSSPEYVGEFENESDDEGEEKDKDENKDEDKNEELDEDKDKDEDEDPEATILKPGSSAKVTTSPTKVRRPILDLVNPPCAKTVAISKTKVRKQQILDLVNPDPPGAGAKEKVETAQEGGDDSGSDSDVTIANDVLDRENPESDSDEECLI